jgi:uncharacterized membrane protein
VISTITAYGVGKFFHVFAAIIAFGPTYAYPFMGAIAGKTDPRSVPTIHRIIGAIDRYLLNPGMVVILIAGFYMVNKGNWDMGQSWIIVGLVSLIVVGAMQGMLFTPWNKQALELSERDMQTGDELSPEYMALTKKIAGAGQFAGVLILLAVFFMTVKP